MITTDPHENPFADFAHLESLSLWHAVDSHGRTDKNEANPESRDDRHPVALALNNLHAQLKSLELAGFPLADSNYPLTTMNKCRVPGRKTTPGLMKALVHISINWSLDYEDFEYFLSLAK